jgi:uncharacterized protein (DUF58 family)
MASRIWWIAVAGLLVASVVQSSGPLFFLDAMLALAGLATYVWGRYALTAVSYTRRFVRLPQTPGAGPVAPAEAQPVARLAFGESTDLWIEVVNAKPLPLAWLKIEDEFPAEIEMLSGSVQRAAAANRRLLTNLLSVRWYERVRRHYRIRAARRGVLEFGPVTLTSGDVFGIRTRSEEIAERQRLLVHPQIVPLEDLGLEPARPYGDRKARRLVQPDPLQLAGARPYVPGDNPRHIHWKATAARADRWLQVKTFDPGAAPYLALVLNAQTMEYLYEGIVPEFFERGVMTAASLAAAAVAARVPVGLYSNGFIRDTEGLVRLPASRQPDHLTRLLDVLAQLTHHYNLAFHDLLRLEASRLPFGATVLAISPFASEAVLAGLIRLRSAGHPVALVVVGDSAPPEAWDVPVYWITRFHSP